jgi:hypothetical protein
MSVELIDVLPGVLTWQEFSFELNSKMPETSPENYRIPNFLDYADNPGTDKIRMEYSINLLLKMMLSVRQVLADYSTLDVISGHAANFHYDRARFWIYDVSPVEPVSTALSRMGWSYQNFHPHHVNDAMEFIKQRVLKSQPVLARWLEPILFYGLEFDSEEKLVFFSPAFAPMGQSLSTVELEMKWWKWADNPDTNLLTVLDNPERLAMEPKELAVTCARETVERAESESFMGSPAGFRAYEAYRDDLSDLGIDFIKQGVTEWSCFAIYHQWTSRRSSQQYFRRAAPLFGGTERRGFEKAATYYEYCLDAWLEWEKHLGRNWSLIDNPDVSKEKRIMDLYERWRDPMRRFAGAQAIDHALHWERKAIAELRMIK